MKFKNGWFNYETSTATALLNAYGAKRAERMVVDVGSSLPKQFVLTVYTKSRLQNLAQLQRFESISPLP